MTVFTQSLADLFKQLLQSLQLPYLFPAAIFTFVTSFLFGINTLLDPFNHIAFLFGVTTILSYLLYALNVPIIRVMEGYKYPGALPFLLSQYCEKRGYDDLQRRIAALDAQRTDLTALKSTLYVFDLLDDTLNDKLTAIENRIIDHTRPLKERCELRYPPPRRDPLPTALGNTIAAFEAYPWSRYRIDAVHMWPRLLPIIVNKKFATFVQQEKNIMDFLLNTCLILLAVCCEFLLVFALLSHNLMYLWVSFPCLFAAYVLYKSRVVAAEHWGGMVRVAFDLYRDDLRKALYLPELPSNDLNAERQLWQTASNFFVFGNEKKFAGFIYPKGDATRKLDEKL